MPLAATVIGLRRGDPGATRLLTFAAAIAAGPLNAALQASQNLRQYARWSAERVLEKDPPDPGQLAGSLQRTSVLSVEREPPSVAESDCAARQLVAWRPPIV